MKVLRTIRKWTIILAAAAMFPVFLWWGRHNIFSLAATVIVYGAFTFVAFVAKVEGVSFKEALTRVNKALEDQE